MKRKLNCILLIDDNEADNNYHKTIIEEMGVAETVQVAENGMEAMIFLTKENQVSPDLIFLDINMPKMNGWEFLEAYKNLEIKQKGNIIIVMLTTSQNPDDKKKAERIKEINGFHVKPINEVGLNQIIEQYFSEKTIEPKKINILLVEDNPADARIIEEYLQEIYKDTYVLATCQYVKKALVELEKNNFDVILLDLTLPDSVGLDSFTTIFKKAPECPIIILTGLNDESVGINAVKFGAQDFLIKNNVNPDSLKHSITHSLERYKLLKALAKNAKILEEKTTDLSRKQQQFEEAQKIAHMGSWEWDLLTNTILWSDELFRIYGLKPQEFVPTFGSADKFIHVDDKGYVTKITRQAYSDKTPFSLNYRIVAMDGRERMIHEVTTILVDFEGKSSKMFGTLQDLTEQRKLEELTKEKEIAGRLAIAKDQFISNMSHEIRTPLNGIIGFTKVLLRNGVTEKQREQLQAIKSSADILLVLINDILDISKMEAGKIYIEETELNLTELINTILVSFELRFEEKKLQIALKFDDRIPKIMMGDPVRIEQILLNLLNNSLKFTNPDGKITIQTNLIEEDEKEASIEFSISDTGIGIQEEKLEEIFKPFVQATRDTTRKYGGTGLGLSIVKRLVELMDGTLFVKSKINEGSTFTFVLPFKKTNATEVSKETKTLLRANELKEIGRLNILLAEDVTINQFLIETIMKGFGFEIDTAENGKIATELMERNDYDIILMDLMMPEMDGYEATKYIRQKMKPPKSRIPIIALTADVNKQVLIKCTEAGMDDYVSKPFDEIELLNKISQLVKKFKGIKMHVGGIPVK